MNFKKTINLYQEASDFKVRESYGSKFEDKIINTIKKSQFFKKEETTVLKLNQDKKSLNIYSNNRGDIEIKKPDKTIYIEAKKSYCIALKSIFSFNQIESQSSDDYYFFLYIKNRNEYCVIKENNKVKKNILTMFNNFVKKYNIDTAFEIKDIETNKNLNDFYRNYYKKELNLDYNIDPNLEDAERNKYIQIFYAKNKDKIKQHYNENKVKEDKHFLLMPSGQIGINTNYFISINKYKNIYNNIKNACDLIIK